MPATAAISPNVSSAPTIFVASLMPGRPSLFGPTSTLGPPGGAVRTRAMMPLIDSLLGRGDRPAMGPHRVGGSVLPARRHGQNPTAGGSACTRVRPYSSVTTDTQRGSWPPMCAHSAGVIPASLIVIASAGPTSPMVSHGCAVDWVNPYRSHSVAVPG